MPPSIRHVIAFSILIVMIMFCFSFAMSPLYSAFCKATGFYNGIRINKNLPDLSRDITIQFVTANNRNLPWDFYPYTKTMQVHPGENSRVLFFAKNNTKNTMTVQAIPSFAPPLAAKYVHKIQCFCFNQQTLNPGESLEMPVIFWIDKQLPRDVNTITLAYTLFDANNHSPSQRTAHETQQNFKAN